MKSSKEKAKSVSTKKKGECGPSRKSQMKRDGKRWPVPCGAEIDPSIDEEKFALVVVVVLFNIRMTDLFG